MQVDYLNTIIEIDEQDVALLCLDKWYITNSGYLFSNKFGFFHRYIFPPPDNLIVDHINRNKLDNRRCNLRHVTYGENTRSGKTKRGQSGVKGVYYDQKRDKFKIEISINNKMKYFGAYPTLEEAAQKAIEIYKSL